MHCLRSLCMWLSFTRLVCLPCPWQAVVVPVDLLKIRLQLQMAVRGAPGYVGPLSLLANVVRTEGLRGGGSG